MSAANELLFEKFSTFQSPALPTPTTVAGAATLTPTQKFTRVTGTTSITKITPPVDAYHELTFVFTTGYANAFNTGGSGDGAIAVAYTSIADRPIDLCYDPRTKLYYPKAVV